MQISPLQTAVHFSHLIWQSILKSGSYVIDATCGNGHDTLFLAKTILAKKQGKIIALDIQKTAILQTSQRLQEKLHQDLLQHVSYYQCCHSEIDQYCQSGADLIVYNLGYLPGSNKKQVTQSKTTLTSLTKSLSLMKVGGYLSITCYPGHEAGHQEAYDVLNWAKKLDPRYISTQHSWINRLSTTPFLLLIQNRDGA